MMTSYTGIGSGAWICAAVAGGGAGDTVQLASSEAAAATKAKRIGLFIRIDCPICLATAIEGQG